MVSEFRFQDTFDMLDRVREEPKSSLGIVKSYLLFYEQRAVDEREKMPFRAVDERLVLKTCHSFFKSLNS